MNVVLTGSPEGYVASVASDGKLATSAQVTGSVQAEVTNTVTVKRSACSVSQSSVSVGTSSMTLVAARTGRQALWLRNVGSETAWVDFEGTTATNGDWPLAAGAEIRAESYRGAGAVTAISTGSGTTVLVVEMF
jgi:hypothetical protein